MIYEFPIVVPANTLAASPVKEDLALPVGIVHLVGVEMPAGCNAKVFLRLFRSEHQVFPNNPDESYASDNTSRDWDEYIEMLDKPLSLRAEAWSPGTTYSHTVRVRIGLLPADVYWRNAPARGVESGLSALLGLS